MRQRWEKFYEWWSLTRVLGALALVFGFVFLVVEQPESSFLSDIAPEFFGIGVTVLLIDWANERRSIADEKAALILQMGSPDNAFAIEAVRILRQKGWLQDGSLQGAYLGEANLKGAFLWRANLQSFLWQANLQGAYLREANLQEAHLGEANLQGIYLGKANLKGANLARASCDENTVLPDGTNWTPDRDWREFTHPEEWAAEQAAKKRFAFSKPPGFARNSDESKS